MVLRDLDGYPPSGVSKESSVVIVVKAGLYRDYLRPGMCASMGKTGLCWVDHTN